MARAAFKDASVSETASVMWSALLPAIKHGAAPPMVGKCRLVLGPADIATGQADVSQEPVVKAAHAAHGTA